MPEAPECEVYRQNLESYLVGERLLSVSVLSGRYLKHGGGPALPSRNCYISKVGRRGKFLWLELLARPGDTQPSWAVLFTLGMTGGFSTCVIKHSRVEFILVGERNKVLYFNDVRNFGTCRIAPMSDVGEKLEHMGPDLFDSEEMPESEWRRHLQKYLQVHRNPVAVEALMDQRLVAGIGNYLKCEALFACRLQPQCRVAEVEELDTLIKAARRIAKRSLVAGGASIRNYSNLFQAAGSTQDLFQVYGKKKCGSEGHQVLREITSDGRSTYWCPHIQTCITPLP